MAAVTQSNDGKKKAMADQELPERSDRGTERDERKAPERVEYRAPQTRKASAPGFFTIYKKGHGYWTRMGTAIGAGLLGAIVTFELYSQIPTFLHGTQQRDKQIAMAAALVFAVSYSLWAYWFTNKPSTVEFLIATDSEMKKVNWTTRKELIGSTKIVIVFMFIIAMFLFTCDLLFGSFFHLVGVLKTWF